MYVHMCRLCLGMLICTHAQICTDYYTKASGRRLFAMEDGKDSAARLSQCMYFVESSTERSRRLATLKKEKKSKEVSQTQSTVEAKESKKRTRKSSKVEKCVRESSQARY